MVITTGDYTIQLIKKRWALMSVLLVLFIACSIIFSQFNPLLILLPLIGFIVDIPFVISATRTIIINENGCTVCWWRYKKHYQWEELTLKQYVHYEGVVFDITSMSDFYAAEFCPKKVRIPKKMTGYMYSSIFHPLSFIYIYFTPTTQNPKEKPIFYQQRYPIPYETDPILFSANLREWGVEMKETKRGWFLSNSR